ncbi:hypothetical protein HMI54_004809 [Coelomomyces lativittatus]|nr:hypothetical protein HMI54_004809 [Coelomomyces lativittatus]KAJ1518413.1 hypothetical protein HMI55_003545 [Coelomomyces lativittatus]
MPTSQMLTTTYDCSVDVTAYAITVAELFLDDLVFHYEEKDDEIKGMFLNSEVQARIGRRFERLSWIPKDIPHLIITALSDRTTQSLDTFIRYLQQYFKHLCFAKDLRVPEVGLALSEFRGGLR